MASVNNYALVETSFSHEPAATGNHVSLLIYRTGCTHVPTIDLGTGNPTATALTLTVEKSTLVAANDASYVTCVWGLNEIRCFANNLTALDVSTSTALTILNCYTNSLTALNVSANTLLKILYCNNNNLTALDVSTNTALTFLYCQTNLFNDAAIDSLIAGMDSVAWTTTAKVLNISSMTNASVINTGTTCTSLGNLASEGWVTTYEQGTCTV